MQRLGARIGFGTSPEVGSGCEVDGNLGFQVGPDAGNELVENSHNLQHTASGEEEQESQNLDLLVLDETSLLRGVCEDFVR